MAFSAQPAGQFGRSEPQSSFAISGPALVRHIGFRVRAADALGERAALRDDRQVVESINAALARLDRPFADRPPAFRLPGEDPSGAGTCSIRETFAASLDFLHESFRPWQARVLVDLHADYYGITFVLDQHLPYETDHPLLAEENAAAHLGLSPDKAHQLQARAFDDIWDEFDTNKSVPLAELPGEVLFELRGLVLRDAAGPFFRKCGAKNRDTGRVMDDASPQFVTARESLHNWMRKNEFFVGEFLDSGEAEPDMQAARDVLCEALYGGAIFGLSRRREPAVSATPSDSFTSLRPPDGAAQRYFVLYNDHSAVQLGHLVTGIHAAEGARIAAQIDLDNVARIGRRVDEIARSFAARQAAMSVNPIPDEILAQYRRAVDAIAASGLTQRIARARASERLLGDRRANLRTEPLEGWQGYDEFARRSLDRALDGIDEIAVQSAALKERIARAGTERDERRWLALEERVAALATLALEARGDRETDRKQREEARTGIEALLHDIRDSLGGMPGTLGAVGGSVRKELGGLEPAIGAVVRHVRQVDRRVRLLVAVLAVLIGGKAIATVLPWLSDTLLGGGLRGWAERYPGALDWIVIAGVAAVVAGVTGVWRLLRRADTQDETVEANAAPLPGDQSEAPVPHPGGRDNLVALMSLHRVAPNTAVQTDNPTASVESETSPYRSESDSDRYREPLHDLSEPVTDGPAVSDATVDSRAVATAEHEPTKDSDHVPAEHNPQALSDVHADRGGDVVIFPMFPRPPDDRTPGSNP